VVQTAPAPVVQPVAQPVVQPVSTPIYLSTDGQIIQGTSNLWGNTPPDGFSLIGYGSGGVPVYKMGGIGTPGLTAPVSQPVTPPAAGTGTGTGTTPTVDPATSPAQAGIPTSRLLKDYLESDPNLMLGLALNKFKEQGASANFTSWFQRGFNQFWQQYLGMLASQAVNGVVPDLSFVDFVTWLDPNRPYIGTNTSQTGRTSSRFAEWAASRSNGA